MQPGESIPDDTGRGEARGDRIEQYHCPCSVLPQVFADGFSAKTRKGGDTRDTPQRHRFEASAESGSGNDDRTAGEQSRPGRVYRAVGSWDWDLAARCLRIDVPGRELRVLVGQEGLACAEPWDRFVHPGDISLLRKELTNQICDRRQGFGIGIRVRYASSSWRWVLVTGSTGSTAETGLPIWIGGAIFEVSSYVMTCPGDTESRDQLPLFLGALRHDLRNRLSVIVGYWGALQERLPKDESLQLYAVRIGQGIDGLSNEVNRIDEILDIGKRMPGWQHFTKIFQAAAASVLPETVSLKLSNDLPDIFADPLLPSVCTNLLDNAVRHGGEVTAISVSVRTEGDAAVVVVEDDGIGVPPALKDRIFDPGYGKHTGYGLYFTRAILERTGLSICERGEEGCGARFEIRVPPGFFRPVQPDTGADPHPAGREAP